MKYGWILLFLSLPLFTSAQNNRIDSLKESLLSLKDSNRVDCLNKLSAEYYKNALPETYYNVQTDTAALFAEEAYRQAVIINYTNGIAEALQNFGEIARDRGDFRLAEKYFRQAIPLFEQLHAREKLSWSHFTFGWSLYKQGNFSAAESAYKIAIPYYIETGNKALQTALLRMISYTYIARGYNEKSFENTLQAIRITLKISDSRGVVSSPRMMGVLYENAGEIETALTYYRLAAQNAKSNKHTIWYNRIRAQICVLLKKPDSALYYLTESHKSLKLVTKDAAIRNKDFADVGASIGGVYFQQHKYDLAIEQFKMSLQFFERGNNRIGVMTMWRDLARCYQNKQDFSLSFLYAKRLLEMAQQKGARPHIRDAYELYWKIYDQQKKVDSAYKYNLKYIAIKDSIMRDEYRRNIAVAEMKSHDEQQKIKINLLQKDQLLIQEQLSIQQQKLRSELLTRNILIGSACVFILVTIFIIRYIFLRRRNEKQLLEHKLALQELEAQNARIEFQKRASDLEMHALRAQMNPHFIFNCLSSINRFILINRTEEASDYLTKFSRLIRMALHNSEKSFIALEDELEALRLYLDLERLRFKNSFNYGFTFINTIDVASVFIPPMLLQPFVENGIWHGLMHKQGEGLLNISFSIEKKILTCIITDDGIGRNKAAFIKSKSAEKNKSMGVQITIDRLALLHRNENEEVRFNIEDITDREGNATGTKVTLEMKYRNLADVYEYQNQ